MTKPMTSPMNTAITASAPGKTILFGEYALMHGAPAVAVATNARLYATIAPEPSKTATPGIDMDAAPWLQTRLSWQAIANPDQYPETVPPTAHLIARMLHIICHDACKKNRPPPSIRITIKSDLPPGSGFGSSAALAASLFYAWQRFAERAPSLDDCYDATLQCEHIAHGKSGGLDPYLATYGGAWGWQASAPHPCALELTGFYAGFSGQSASSTRECVAHVMNAYPANHPIWRDFQAVCTALLETDNTDTRLAALREHHQLQTALGVVPEAVQTHIANIEKQGAAAKVSGAGSTTSNAAGAIILYDPHKRIRQTNQLHKPHKTGDTPAHFTLHTTPYKSYAPLSATNQGAGIAP